MNLRKGFRITTWVLSVIAFVGFVAGGIYDIVESDYEYSSNFFEIVIDVVEGDYEYSVFLRLLLPVSREYGQSIGYRSGQFRDFEFFTKQAIGKKE